MVNTPTHTQTKIVIDHEFREKYPPGIGLELYVEDRTTPFVCKIDSYFVDNEVHITVGATVIDLKNTKVKEVTLAMDPQGNIGVYNRHNTKIAIVSRIVLPEQLAHEAVRTHGGKVHRVVLKNKHTEEHV